MSDHLRVGDAERERAAADLGEHYVEGRLTTEEHAERLDAVWAARPRADLAPVFGDLPARRPSDTAARPPVRRSRPRPSTPVLAVAGGLVVLTVLTHLPFILLALLLFVVVRHHRRRRGWLPSGT